MSAAVAGMPPVYSFHGSEEKMGERRDGFFVEEEEEEEALSESSSVGAASAAESSIGENSSSEAGGKDAEEEEVQSKAKGEEEDEQGLGTLESLEDSLPIKRGLSNFYAGKSKSFTSLAEAASAAAVKELAKPENPFNKRRRVLAAWSRRASCSSLVTTFLPALLAPDHAVAEGDEGEEESDDDDDEDLPHNTTKNAAPALPPPRLNVTARNRTFRSPRSFSLSDLRNTGYN